VDESSGARALETVEETTVVCFAMNAMWGARAFRLLHWELPIAGHTYRSNQGTVAELSEAVCTIPHLHVPTQAAYYVLLLVCTSLTSSK